MGNPLSEPCDADYIIEHGVQVDSSHPLAWVSINGQYIWREVCQSYQDACYLARAQVSVANWLLEQLSENELRDELYVVREMIRELEDAQL